MGGLSGLVVCLCCATGAASVLYPTALRELLALDVDPKCVLCHTTDTGGTGTAVKPFAQTLKTLGIEGSNEATLISAIRANIYDTDRDGVTDVQEIKDGTDPNVKDREVEPPEEPVGSGTGGANGGGPTGAAGDTESAAGGMNAELPLDNQGGAAEPSQEPSQEPSAGPSLAPPPPPPTDGEQNIPLRETGCAVSRPRRSTLATALLIGAAFALASRRRRNLAKVRSDRG